MFTAHHDRQAFLSNCAILESEVVRSGAVDEPSKRWLIRLQDIVDIPFILLRRCHIGRALVYHRRTTKQLESDVVRSWNHQQWSFEFRDVIMPRWWSLGAVTFLA